MAKLTPQQFVSTYKPYAIACWKKTGIHYHALLTQAALESEWGEQASGNNLFGIKDTDGINGNEQLLTTTEILATDKAKFPIILSITKIGNWFKYLIKDYFRKYDDIEQCFNDHAQFFLDNVNYRYAWSCRGDAEEFLRQVAKAGYATDPNYEKDLIDTLHWFQRNS